MTSAAGTDVWARTWIGWDIVFYAAVATLIPSTGNGYLPADKAFQLLEL